MYNIDKDQKDGWYSTCIRMAKRQTSTTSAGKDIERLEFSYVGHRNAKLHNLSGKDLSVFLS